MRRPALFIAVSFAAGILAGPSAFARLPHAFVCCFVATACISFASFLLLAARRTTSAWILSLCVWCLAGGAAAIAEPLATPANLVTSLASTGKLDLSQPLRWHGTLRADPLRLPWGIRYLIDLDEVQFAGTWTAVTDGLRASYFFDERANGDPAPVRAGDRVEILAKAETVRDFGDPGAFDYRTFLARQDIHLTATLRNAALMTLLDRPAPTMAQRMARARGALIAECDAMLADDPPRAAVARAMLLGDRSFLDSPQIEPFQQTGVYHVLVVAGLHVGFVVFALLWVCRKLRMPLLASTLVTIAGLAAYVGIVEDRPPIFRAALMATAYLLARLMFRRTDLLNVIALAALAILAFRPSELSDSSFLLSFLAAATIGGLAAPLLETTTERYIRGLDHLSDATRDPVQDSRVAQFRLDLRGISRWLAEKIPGVARHANAAVTLPCRAALRLSEMALISIALQIGMLPLMAQYFHRVSIVAPAANLPAVLLTGIIVPLGLVALSIGAVWSGVGHILGRALSAAIGTLIASVHYFARPAWSSYRVPTPPVVIVVLFFVAAVLCSFALFMRKHAGWVALVALLVLGGLIAVYPFAARLQPGHLELTVLDVGQGDSIFVAFPNGRTMLVDGGGLPGSAYIRGMRPGIDVGEDVVSPFLWARGIKRLDAVVLTHGHEDHLGGLPAVLRNFRVGALWIGRDVESVAFRELLATARDRHVTVIHQLKGNFYNWDGVGIRVLWPPDDDTVKTANNDDSVVLRLEEGDQSVLLSGDIERPVENNLVADQDQLSAEFLKVPHHGSKTSSTQPFLDAVHPRIAAISVGANNSFGHPNEEVLERLTSEGVRLLRTDRDGAITATLDGHTLNVHAYLVPPQSAAASTADQLSPRPVPAGN